MKLIADSGSTKTDWAVIESGQTLFRFQTRGYNPNLLSPEEMQEDFKKISPTDFPYDQIKEVYFYGAGVSDLMKPYMKEMLSLLFPQAETLETDSDLIAACKALLGDRPGLVVILGTGSNSCLYDGAGIAEKVDALGYILGDEGSGSYIGKTLIAQYLRKEMPESVRIKFSKVIRKTRDEIIQQIYTRPAPNKYCAQFTHFVADHMDAEPYLRQLVKSSFEDFFHHVIVHYPDFQNLELNAVGSVAFYFKDILEEVAAEHKMKVGRILETPIEHLIAYYLK